MCSGKDRRYASLRISYWYGTCSRRNIGAWRTVLYTPVCARLGVCTASGVRSFLPRAYAPVKISISVEHSIVMAMCLSSYGRSSSAAPRFRLQRTRRNARAVEQMDRKVCLSFAPGRDSLAKGWEGGGGGRILASRGISEKKKEFLLSLSHW